MIKTSYEKDFCVLKGEREFFEFFLCVFNVALV